MPTKKNEPSKEETMKAAEPAHVSADGIADGELPEISQTESAVADTEAENLPEEMSAASGTAEAETPAPPPKRSRKKKEEPEPVAPERQESAEAEPLEIPEEAPASTDAAVPYGKSEPILTVEARGDVETEDGIADAAWHEIHNAYRTRRILTGLLGGIEQTDNGKTLVVVEYKGYRVVIPLKEMVVGIPNHLEGSAYSEWIIGQHKRLSRMLGAEIDFIVRGIDSKARSVVASRRGAMLKKRQTFYMADENGVYKVYEGRIVQARVIMVAEKAIRVEVFGVECNISARDLSWDWIGDAAERFSVGDRILVRIREVNRETIESVTVKADVKSVSENRQSRLPLCRIQGKYAGKVTDVHKGVIFIRLTNGVNAIAHTCLDRRMPGKKDDVSFAVTHIDEERDVALGIITRIIRQNL